MSGMDLSLSFPLTPRIHDAESTDQQGWSYEIQLPKRIMEATL